MVLWDDTENDHPALEFAEHLRREVQAYASGWTATISVGPRCTDVREYGDAYRLTCGVLDLVQQSDRHDRVVSLDSIGAYRLLLQVKRPQELQCFAESMLGTVHVYDEQAPDQARRHAALLHGQPLQRLGHRQGAARAPEHGGLPLRRVEELLEIDLSDPQAMLHLQLALMIEGSGDP